MFVLRRVRCRNALQIGRRATFAVRLQSSLNISSPPQEEAIESGVVEPPKDEFSSPRPAPKTTSKRLVSQKLIRVATQVKYAISSSTTDLLEAVDMFGEALVYLNEIKRGEDISDRDIFIAFQGRFAEIIEKALIPGVLLGSKTIEDVFAIAGEHGICRPFFCWVLAKHYFETCEDKMMAYRQTLALWVNSLGYRHEAESSVSREIINRMGPEFKAYQLTNMVYFAYLETCRQERSQPETEAVQKLLQTDSVPPLSFIRATLKAMGLLEKYGEEVQGLAKTVSNFEIQNMDPNGPIAHARIDRAAKKLHPGSLDAAYNDILTASKITGNSLTERTLSNVMNAYTDAGFEQEALKIFQKMVKSGVNKPLIISWCSVLLALGSPGYMKNSGHTQEKVSQTIDDTVAAILASGTELNAKALALIVSGYASANSFDKVEKAIEKYSTEGNGKLPLINRAKDGVTIGKLRNGMVLEAEAGLKVYMTDGSGYVPSTSVMNAFLDYYAKQKNFEAAEGILSNMRRLQIAEDIYTYTILIDVYFKMYQARGIAPDVNGVMRNLKKSGEEFTDVTYASLIDGLIKNGLNMEAAREVFSIAIAKTPRSPHLYSIMAKGELEWGLIGIAENLFQQYLQKVGNDPRMWNMMISLLLHKNEDLAMQYYERFKGIGATSANRSGPNIFTFYYLLRHFMKRSNKAQIQYVIEEISRSKLGDLGTQLPSLLKSVLHTYIIPADLKQKLDR